MPLTYEQRVELLKKAREAKKNKKLAKVAEAVDEETEEPMSTPEKPKKTRAKKVKEEGRTLEIKEPEKMPDFVDSEPEIEEQIIYKPKEKKKKKIIRKVIMEASSDEEEVEVIEERVKAPKKVREHAPERQKSVSVPETPKNVSPSKSSFFNF
jgi:hypothetical protein